MEGLKEGVGKGSWLPHALAVYLPFAVAFYVREYVVDWEYFVTNDPWNINGLPLGVKWLVHSPWFNFHYPSVTWNQLAAIYVFFSGPVDFDLHRFQAFGQGINLALVVLLGAWLAKLAHARGGSPLWLLAIAAATASMPAMNRFAGLWSPYFPFGLFLMGAGVASCYALSSRFADRYASSSAAVMLGLAFSQMFIAAVPIVSFGGTALVLAASSKPVRERLFGFSASGEGGVHRFLAFAAAVAFAMAFLGLLINALYGVAGRYWITLAIAWGISLLSLIPGFTLRGAATRLVVAGLLQAVVYSLAVLAHRHLNIPSIAYPQVVFSTFPATLLILALWRIRGFRGLMLGPLGWAAIAVLCSANIVTPYLAETGREMVTYKERYHPNRIAAPEQVQGVDIIPWDIFLFAVPLAVVVLFAVSRRIRGHWPLGLAVLVLLAGVAGSSWDLLFVDFSRPEGWGYRGRFMLPLAFALPLVFWLAWEGGRYRWPALAGTLVLAVATLADYARMDFEPARQTFRDREALLEDAISRERAGMPKVRVICTPYFPQCVGPNYYYTSLEGEFTDRARHLIVLSQNFRRADGVVFSDVAYAVKNPPPDDELFLYAAEADEFSRQQAEILKRLAGEWTEIPAPPGVLILRRIPAR